MYNNNAFINQKNHDTWDNHFHEQYKQQQFQQVIDDPNTTYYDHFIPNNTQQDLLQEPNQDWFIKKIKSVVPVSSKERDISEFPNPNHFVFYLPKTFHNIEKIELVACSFPNAANVIKGVEDNSLQNNRIFWRNYNDIFDCFYDGVDVNPQIEFTYDSLKGGYYFTIPNYTCSLPRLDVQIYNSQNAQIQLNGKRTVYYVSTLNNNSTFFMYFSNLGSGFFTSISMPAPVYHIDIVPGNYTITNLVSQIELQMNQVQRIDGSFHNFKISQSNDTDIITFKNYSVVSLDSNPFSSTLADYNIIVTQPGHTFLKGDTILISGAQTFNGVSSSILNNEFIITDINDVNSFIITINQLPSATGSGGGPNVFTGSIYPFQFIFGPNNRYLDSVYSKSISNNLGFNIENSGVLLNQQDPFSTISIKIDSMVISPSNPNFSRIFFSNVNSSLFVSKTITITSVLNNVITFIDSGGVPNTESSLYFSLNMVSYYNDLNQLINVQKLNGYLKVVRTSPTTMKILEGQIVIASSGVLKLGTLVKVSELDTEPSMVNKGIQGTPVFFVEQVGSNYIDIDYLPTFIGNVKDHYIYTGILKVTHPNHSFNIVDVTVTDLTNYVVTSPFNNFEPSPSSLCNAAPNGLFTDFTLTSGTLPFEEFSFQHVYLINSTFTFGRKQYLAYITSSTTFTIVFGLSSSKTGITANFTNYRISLSEFVPNSGYTFGLNHFFNNFSATNNTIFIRNTSKFEGPLINSGSGKANFKTKRNEIVYYRIKSNIKSSSKVYNVALSELNDTYFDVQLIDSNSYYITLDKQFFETSHEQSFGGSDIFINSDLHGWNYNLSNTKDWTLNTPLNKGIRLSGDDRVYLCCKGLPTVYKKEIDDGFAEIILDQQPGSICFNSFVTEPFVFQNLKDKLSLLEFKVLYDTGDLYSFNNLEFSFTLKITEVQNVLENQTITGLSNKEIYMNK